LNGVRRLQRSSLFFLNPYPCQFDSRSYFNSSSSSLFLAAKGLAVVLSVPSTPFARWFSEFLFFLVPCRWPLIVYCPLELFPEFDAILFRPFAIKDHFSIPFPSYLPSPARASFFLLARILRRLSRFFLFNCTGMALVEI